MHSKNKQLLYHAEVKSVVFVVDAVAAAAAIVVVVAVNKIEFVAVVGFVVAAAFVEWSLTFSSIKSVLIRLPIRLPLSLTRSCIRSLSVYHAGISYDIHFCLFRLKFFWTKMK